MNKSGCEIYGAQAGLTGADISLYILVQFLHGFLSKRYSNIRKPAHMILHVDINSANKRTQKYFNIKNIG